MVHFLYEANKRAGEIEWGREDGGRDEEESRSRGDPAEQACCLLRLSSFTVTPLLFTLFLSGLFPCFHSPGIIFSLDCACRLSCSLHLSVIIVCLALCLLLTQLPFLNPEYYRFSSLFYVLYISSPRFIQYFQEWRPLVKNVSVCVCVGLGTMKCFVFINKSSYIEHKSVCYLL